MKYNVDMEIEATSTLDLEIKLNAIKALLECFPKDSLQAIGKLEMQNPGAVKKIHDVVLNFANTLSQNPIFTKAVKSLTPLFNQQVKQLNNEINTHKLLG